MLRDPAIGGDDMELPVVAPGIGGEQRGEGFGRCLPIPQPGHPVDGQQRIDQGLRGDGADATFGARADGTDGEEPGGHRHAQFAGRRIMCED